MADLMIKDKTPADAAEMLSEMSPDNYQALMTIIVHVYNDDQAAQKNKNQSLNKKQKAFSRMQELRKKAHTYYGSDFNADAEIAEAIEEKYGRVN